jgi:hypothetical protein
MASIAGKASARPVQSDIITSMTCGASPRPVGVQDYCLSALGTKPPPNNMFELEEWLSANSPHGHWLGKIYVASTISWTGNAFMQKGCSPNYHAGWWTLCCCKHQMRSARPINDALAHPANIAVFIFTLAKQDASRNQNLVSVAQVTRHFPDMTAYAQHLLRSRNTALVSSRLSRRRRNDGWLGWRFGDCHSDRSGAIGAPHVDHEHGFNRGHCWAADNAPGHTLLMSDCFLMWPRPTFSSSYTLKDSCYGHNINPSNLRRVLK